MDMLIAEPTYDKQTKIITGPQNDYVPDPKGLGHAYYTQMHRNRNKLFQYHVQTGVTETFGSVLSRSQNTSIEMRNKGVQPGDVISICASNSMDNYIPYIAAFMTGAVIASVDPSISLVDMIYLLNQVQPKLIFVDQTCEILIENALQGRKFQCEIIIIGDSNKYSNLQEFTVDKNDTIDYEPCIIDDLNTTAVILFSSGTTGLPKGIKISHYGIFAQANILVSSGLDVNRLLTFATTYWITTVLFIAVEVIYGNVRCVCDTFSAKDCWQIFDNARITMVLLNPFFATALLKAGRPDGLDTTSLSDVVIAGGHMTARNILALRDLLPGTYVQLSFGQTEACGMVTIFRTGNRKDILLGFNKPESAGRPIKGFRYKIVHPETNQELGPNENGELHYTYEGIMRGYHNADSSEGYDENGWIKSGDIGYYDEDFCFYIVDRIKDMLKFQGFHVTPAKIESVLNQHPQVVSSIVIGIPNDNDGDHPMGLVVLQPGATITEDELVAFVEQHVDDRNRLRAGIRFLNSFPFTPSGKIRKYVLKKKILAGEI